MNSRIRSFVLIVAVVVAYVAMRAVWSAYDATSATAALSQQSGVESRTYVDTTVQLALRPNESLKTRTYTGGRGNPFLPSGKGAYRPTAAKARPQREELHLNGVLLRASKPQAILADNAGNTFIAGVGDKVHDQKIIKIAPNKVTLKHGRSTYSIQVRD